MKIYIAAGETSLGPYTVEEIREAINDGSIQADGLGCIEGESAWHPISAFLNPRPADPVAVAVSKPAASAAKPAQAAAAKPTPTPKTDTPPLKPASKSCSSSGAITSGAIGVAILSFLSWKLTAIERLLDKKVTPPAFEYMVTAPKDYAFDSQMTALGRQGWEVVSARRATSSSEYDKTASYEVILKRQIR